MHPLRNVFNKITYDTKERAGNYVVYFVHRGVPGDTREINASVITKVGPSWFTYATAESDETLIPFHRVRRIVDLRTGQAIWISRTRESV
jgi:uncharacterized protein (UPF0248 family)